MNNYIKSNYIVYVNGLDNKQRENNNQINQNKKIKK